MCDWRKKLKNLASHVVSKIQRRITKRSNLINVIPNSAKKSVLLDVSSKLTLPFTPKRRYPDGATPPTDPSPRRPRGQKIAQYFFDPKQGNLCAGRKITLLDQTSRPQNHRSDVNFSPQKPNTWRSNALAALATTKADSRSKKIVDNI